MEKFFALSQKKQNAIINAGIFVFGKMGYKKASINDIATAAGISKGMIFHYFGSKKNLYLYLGEISFNIIYKAFEAKFDKNITDFFDRIMIGTEIKLSVIKEHPAILVFLGSIYFETDLEVKSDIQKFISKGELFRNQFAFNGMDVSKFKDSVDPKLVLKILVKFAEGYVSNTQIDENFDLDKMIKEFTECVQLMKSNFYKEEYL